MARRAPLVFAALPACLAAFTNPFEDLAEGGEFEVTWEALPGGGEAGYIQGRVFNDTGDGVTAFQANVSSTLQDRSFTWSNIPYPLPYIPAAHYEVELIPQQPANQSNQSSPSTTIKSPLFSISPSPKPPPADSEPAGTATPEAEQAPSGPGTNAIIVAVCVSLGIPIFIAAAVCIWWTRRHRRRARYEESRRRRYETIID